MTKMIGTGILAITSRLDGSWIGVYVLNVMSWVTFIFSLFLVLSAIPPIEAYPYNGLFAPGDRVIIELLIFHSFFPH
jgi:hypothetical protein